MNFCKNRESSINVNIANYVLVELHINTNFHSILGKHLYMYNYIAINNKL